MNAHARLYLALAAALVAAGARAQGATAPGQEVTPGAPATPSTQAAAAGGTAQLRRSPRALNGLVFQPSALLTEPFATTSFGMTTYFGGGEANAPRYDLSGNQIGTRKYPTAVYGQDIDLQLRLTPDIALRLNVNGLIFSGINARGLLVVGATAQAGLLTGLVAGRDLSPTTRLAFVVDFGITPQFSELVGNAVLSAAQTGDFDSVGLFSNVQRLRGSPGLSFAWAPYPAMGFIAETRYIWTRRITSDDSSGRTTHGVSLGGLGALDLDPVLHVPIAVQASYRADLGVSSNGIPDVHQFGLGFFYSRRAALALGLEALWRHGVIRAGTTPTLNADTALVGLRLRYYW